MIFSSYRPPPPLSAHVDSIWYYQGTDLEHSMERILPNGAMQLLVNLDQDELRWHEGPDLSSTGRETLRTVRGSALSGAWSRAIAIDTAQQRVITGVSFLPGGGAAFFRESVTEFTNNHVSLQELPECRYLREQMLELAQPAKILRCWVQFLFGCYQEPAERWLPLARQRLALGEPVALVANQLNLSARRFRNAFTNQVGISPKRYLRIERLQRVAQAVACSGNELLPAWAELAQMHGYFDQAHMIHDFKALAAISPTQFKPRSPTDWNHAVIE